MKITSLVENISRKENIGAEHGLSLFIETESHNILFDMGQTDLFSENAEKLSKFLKLNDKAKVYINKNAFGDYYNGTEKYIGLDKSLSESSRIVLTDDFCEIEKGLLLYSCNDREKKYNLGSFGLKKKKGENFISDDFIHEHYLLIEENGKKILISGCSHKGILNIAEWFSPDILIGGFHFSKLDCNLDALLLKKYAQELLEFPTKYYTCHCTGKKQYLLLKEIMDKNIEYISAGDNFSI